MRHRTRVVDCVHCGATSAYAAIPEGTFIATEDSACESATASCVSCGHDFRVYYSPDE